MKKSKVNLDLLDTSLETKKDEQDQQTPAIDHEESALKLACESLDKEGELFIIFIVKEQLTFVVFWTQSRQHIPTVKINCAFNLCDELFLLHKFLLKVKGGKKT